MKWLLIVMINMTDNNIVNIIIHDKQYLYIRLIVYMSIKCI